MHYFIPTEKDNSSIMSESSCDGSIGCGTESELENEDSEQSKMKVLL